MSAIPHEALSEAFEKAIRGRRIQAAIFLTYRFDPAFFEQEVLPVFLDQDVTNVPAIRLVNLEEALIRDIGPIAVYYDRQGLVGEHGAAHLAETRVPITWRRGVFHPKNVLAILEDREADRNDVKSRSLLIATMSANLTRAGWWENVEVCHIEEVAEGGRCAFRDNLLYLCRQLRALGSALGEPEALGLIHKFVLGLDQRISRSGDGVLHTHMYVGRERVSEFLRGVLGRRVREWNLEIISPYFDEGAKMIPLHELIDEFEPRAVRVLLPRGRDASAQCDKWTYGAIEGIPNASWGRLPGGLLASGSSKDAPPRNVHAKVYRFFSPSEGSEITFLGSPNLTSAGHSGKGNYETGILVETVAKGRPTWWLEVDEHTPTVFKAHRESDDADPGRGIFLNLRYDWDRKAADAYWDDESASPALNISAQGSSLFRLESLQPKQWISLSPEPVEALDRILRSTSFLTVETEESSPATILVIEEGMASKPSILFSLTPAEILKYWTILSSSQREAILTNAMSRAGILPPDVVSRLQTLGGTTDSFFDSFAGIFHAFASLERAVFDAIKKGSTKELEYRLFGNRHDSLPTLLDKVIEDPKGDLVDAYVIFLCAKQLLDRLSREHHKLEERYRPRVKALKERLRKLDDLRSQFSFDTPADREGFFDWFDERFLARAKPEEVEAK